MERIVSKGDDFVVDTRFYFKPVQRFEFRALQRCSALKQRCCLRILQRQPFEITPKSEAISVYFTIQLLTAPLVL